MTHPTLPTSRSLSDHARAAAVRATLAGDDLHARLLASARRRAGALDDDRGSQTAEYAMVGGVGAAAAGALITCIKNKDIFDRVMEGVVAALLKTIKSWF